MPDLGTNVPEESLQHMLNCKNGKHELGATQKAFWYDHHYYVYAQCIHCNNSYYTKDGKVISKGEFYVAYDEQRKTYE